MRRIKSATAAMFFILIAANSLLHAEKSPQGTNDPSQDPRVVAESGLYSWVNNFIVSNIQPDKDFVLDVKSLQQLQAVYLGRSFAMKVVDPNQLMSGKSLQQATHSNGEWRYVVMSGRRPVGLATVRQISGKYEFTGLGGKELAKDIEATLAPYPSREANLVRSHQALQDYVELSDSTSANTQYAQLQSTIQSERPVPGSRTSSISNRTAPSDVPALMTDTILASKLREAISRNAAMEGNQP